MKLSDSDTYLIKLKALRLSNEKIAEKLGIHPNEVERRWQSLSATLVAATDSGYANLCDRFSILCAQYQLVGESLKEIARALGESVSVETLRNMISTDPEETLQRLKGLIILKPYVPQPEVPEKN